MPELYNIDLVNLIIDGKYVTDFNNGSSITLARNADSVIANTGIKKGEVAYAVNNDETGTITFELQHTSPANNWLDEASRNGRFISVSLIDSNDDGAIKIQNNKCMIIKQADNTRGTEIGVRSWSIHVPIMNM